MDKVFEIVEKKDVDGTEILETNETKTIVTKTYWDRVSLVNQIARLTDELAVYQKLLTDMDATPVSLTP